MNWRRAYQTRGAAGLEDQRAGGNNRKLDDIQKADLLERLQSYTPAQVFGPQAASRMGSSGPWRMCTGQWSSGMA